MKIAITGQFASGKTSAVGFFSRLGYKTVSADKIAHILLEKPTVKNRILRHFGSRILAPSGKISRANLGGIVFAREKERIFLEKILHPLIRKEILSRIEKPGRFVVENPLLFEMKMEKHFDFVIYVDCPHGRWLRNLRGRKIPFEKAEAIVRAQKDQREKRKCADFVAVNDSSLKKFETELMKIAEAIEKIGRGD
ncbi:MAG: dephospho-CoA kinase [Elusimicrobia bacterium]|nr:dephospho-CoA kinase [Elusimicrobiota bacterium]